MDLGRIVDSLMRGQGDPRHQNQPHRGQQQQSGLGNMMGGSGGLASQIPGGLGGLAAGSLLSMILGSKAGRSTGGSLMKAGGLAVLASVAFKAYQDWQAKQAPNAGQGAGLPTQPPPAGSGFNLDEEKDKEGHEMGVALVQAMISAAKSDGHLDGEESRRIQEQIQELGLGNEEKGFLLDVMSKPADAAAIARLPRTKEQASELYVASLVAIGDADTPEEKAYLDRLAALLDLPADLVAHLDSQVSAARKAVASA
ncbi:tellurite resistance TerB family protein [Microvirga roseola]|uniref:tellurite resistance TerB family protein n=1 Tax=Microvirga roseola TaxID=2883126 RepID=UPI001E60FBBC|nr:tellurite resistance TerB family protein [Microvirga roseola]